MGGVYAHQSREAVGRDDLGNAGLSDLGEGGERLRLGVRRDRNLLRHGRRGQVTTAEGEAVEFGAGDLVTFPRGLKCTWEVRKPIRKTLPVHVVPATAQKERRR